MFETQFHGQRMNLSAERNMAWTIRLFWQLFNSIHQSAQAKQSPKPGAKGLDRANFVWCHCVVLHSVAALLQGKWV